MAITLKSTKVSVRDPEKMREILTRMRVKESRSAFGKTVRDGSWRCPITTMIALSSSGRAG
jgi:hypothetical protein